VADKRVIHIAQPALDEAEWQAVREPILSGWVTQGPQVAALERAFAERQGVAHALAASSGTTALHLMLAAMEIGPGDEVIVPVFTWVATAATVCYCGATPVFADVRRETFNIAPAQVAAKITPRTRAILPVHLFGRCADMDALADAAGDVPLLEDAACAAGATHRGRPAGSMGLAAAFSFHPRKSITTGEGGMVTTNDAALAERVAQLRNHGGSISEEQKRLGPKPWLLGEFNLLGFNYRLSDVLAAIGRVQLGKLDGLLAERRKAAAFYADALGGIDWLRLPAEPEEGSALAWQAYVTYVDEAKSPRTRNEIMEALQEKGVATRPGTHAVHMLGYYRDRFGLAPDDFPAARDCDAFSMAIPLHNRMTEDDYAYVADAIRALA
jgi:dTDP-4-amino-4,6-dideoxygalactose transaminase